MAGNGSLDPANARDDGDDLVFFTKRDGRKLARFRDVSRASDCALIIVNVFRLAVVSVNVSQWSRKDVGNKCHSKIPRYPKVCSPWIPNILNPFLLFITPNHLEEGWFSVRRESPSFLSHHT